MIKFWKTTFWLLWNHAIFMNQKVVLQNFIIEQTGDKYFNTILSWSSLLTCSNIMEGAHYPRDLCNLATVVRQRESVPPMHIQILTLGKN